MQKWDFTFLYRKSLEVYFHFTLHSGLRVATSTRLALTAPVLLESGAIADAQLDKKGKVTDKRRCPSLRLLEPAGQFVGIGRPTR